MTRSNRNNLLATTTLPAVDVGETDRPVRHLTQAEVARRWRMSERTLENWRLCGKGPAHLQIGGVLYRLVDIEEFERAQLRHKAVRRSKSKLGSDADESR